MVDRLYLYFLIFYFIIFLYFHIFSICVLDLFLFYVFNVGLCVLPYTPPSVTKLCFLIVVNLLVVVPVAGIPGGNL